VTTVTAFPYDCMVLIESPDPSNGSTRTIGSGVAIGPHTVLTASHIVFNPPTQTALSTIDLYLAWSGPDPALGPGYLNETGTTHYNVIGTYGSDLLSKADSAKDLALIDTNYTFSDWMSFSPDYQGGTVHVTGYPQTAGGYQTDVTGTVTADPNYAVLDYGTLSSSPGNSGSPLWTDINGSPSVVGVVSTGGWAAQITPADIALGESDVSQDGYSFLSPFSAEDTTTQQAITPATQDYTGPVANIQHQCIDTSSDGLNMTANTSNWFLHSGSGEDALTVSNGTNVLDGGAGSNFLTGGSGTDTFFVDDRNATADIWSTVNNLHAGDAATIWGVTPQDHSLTWVDGQGAVGYTGLTLHATAPGAPTASLTLVGFTQSDLNDGRLSVSYGSSNGSSYMYVHDNS
jgi:V8-like Glu-specific endopeptidase